MPREAPPPGLAPRATLAALFYEFLKVSLLGFGGGIVWAHRIAVERRAWLSEDEFADILSVCQFMPGPNIVGIAVCTGAKLRGLSGAIAAFCGFALIPGAAGFALALVYLDHTRLPLLQNILRGISATAAGLMIGTGLRLLKAQHFRPMALLFAALAWTAIVVGKLPLLIVLLGLAPLSVAGAALVPAGRR
jgi:chromate transporter